jgi:hypothetical protein
MFALLTLLVSIVLAGLWGWPRGVWLAAPFAALARGDAVRNVGYESWVNSPGADGPRSLIVRNCRSLSPASARFFLVHSM